MKLFVSAAMLAASACGVAAPVVHTPAPVHKTACATYDIEVKVHEGMPGDYVLHFCAPGIRAGYYTCPRDSYTLPQPGERMNCRAVPAVKP